MTVVPAQSHVTTAHQPPASHRYDLRSQIAYERTQGCSVRDTVMQLQIVAKATVIPGRAGRFREPGLCRVTEARSRAARRLRRRKRIRGRGRPPRRAGAHRARRENASPAWPPWPCCSSSAGRSAPAYLVVQNGHRVAAHRDHPVARAGPADPAQRPARGGDRSRRRARLRALERGRPGDPVLRGHRHPVRHAAVQRDGGADQRPCRGQGRGGAGAQGRATAGRAAAPATTSTSTR